MRRFRYIPYARKELIAAKKTGISGIALVGNMFLSAMLWRIREFNDLSSLAVDR
jgi:hypothetical protein